MVSLYSIGFGKISSHPAFSIWFNTEYGSCGCLLVITNTSNYFVSATSSYSDLLCVILSVMHIISFIVVSTIVFTIVFTG